MQFFSRWNVYKDPFIWGIQKKVLFSFRCIRTKGRSNILSKLNSDTADDIWADILTNPYVSKILYFLWLLKIFLLRFFSMLSLLVKILHISEPYVGEICARNFIDHFSTILHIVCFLKPYQTLAKVYISNIQIFMVRLMLRIQAWSLELKPLLNPFRIGHWAEIYTTVKYNWILNQISLFLYIMKHNAKNTSLTKIFVFDYWGTSLSNLLPFILSNFKVNFIFYVNCSTLLTN